MNRPNRKIRRHILALAFATSANATFSSMAHAGQPTQSPAASASASAVVDPQAPTHPPVEAVAIPMAGDNGQQASVAPPSGPAIATAEGVVQVHAPQYGLNLEKVERDGYTYKRRQWRDMVRNDPELMMLHRRGKLLVPGIVLSAVGTGLLALSITAEIDDMNTASATEGLIQWGVPLALLGSGIPMLVVGVRNRTELNRRQRELMAAPVALQHGAGFVVGGRF